MLIGLVVAGAIFTVAWKAGGFIVWRYYLDEDKVEQRNRQNIENFQKYVLDEKLSINDTELIKKWSDGKYIELVVYKNGSLVFTPDWFETDTDGSDDSDIYNDIISGERGFEQYLTEEARIRYERILNDILDENQNLSPIIFRDGTLLAAVIDYSEDFVYNIVFIISLGLAFVVFAVIMAFCFTNITARITRLAHNVKKVEQGQINMPVNIEGNDEISTLASDVNSMRNTVVENMSKEREAWEANAGLITAMSHDIRTPLTVLLGYLDLMQIQNHDPVMREYLEACRENALRLKKLSDDLFSYFLVFGKRNFDITLNKYNSDDVLRHMIEEHTILLAEKGYVFEKVWDAENREINIDTVYLGRVIDNVFSNIGKYADVNSPVRISVYVKNGYITLEFENTVCDGKGAESNGIGTKTCSKIMEQMGGSFVCENVKGKFVTIVNLPVSE